MVTRRGTRRWRAGALLLVALLLLAACGGDGDDAPGGAATDDGADTASEDVTQIASDGEPQEGGELVTLVASYVDNLDVQKISSFNVQDQAGPAYSRLVAFSIPDEEIEYGEQVIEPDLATEWEVSDDGLTYTFTLRDDVVWHDVPPVNGRPFVASDVVASMNRVKNEGFAAYMLERVDEIVAVDDHTVEFRLSAPFAPLLGYLASHYMWILPEEATNGGFDPATTAIGTGPFIIASRDPNVELVYERNPDYFGEMPKIERYRRLIVPDQGARINAFRAGEADIISGLSPEESEQLVRTAPGSVKLDLPSAGHIVIYVNQARDPMSILEFRKAISASIDREGLGTTIAGGGQYSGPVTSALGKWALPQDELQELYPYDTDLAAQYLQEAGLENPRIGVMVTPGYGEQVTRAAQWIVEDLAEVGITGEIEIVEYATYFGSRWPQQQYDIIVGLQTPFTEPDEWLRAQHGTGASRNWFGISDPELDAMLEDQLAILDEQERVDAVHDIQRYIIENVMNPIPVWNYLIFTNVSERVRDHFPDPYYGFHEYRRIWLDQE